MPLLHFSQIGTSNRSHLWQILKNWSWAGVFKIAIIEQIYKRKTTKWVRKGLNLEDLFRRKLTNSMKQSYQILHEKVVDFFKFQFLFPPSSQMQGQLCNFTKKWHHSSRIFKKLERFRIYQCCIIWHTYNVPCERRVLKFFSNLKILFCKKFDE